MFAHDDAAPDRGRGPAPSSHAADQWDADVVGPKLVRVGRPAALRAVRHDRRQGRRRPAVRRAGRAATRASTTACATCSRCPGAFTLVRAARFAEVGGFDEAISFLVRRPQPAPGGSAWPGGKVLVTSAARVRHARGVRRPSRRRGHDRPPGRPPPRPGAAELVPVVVARHRGPAGARRSTVVEAVGAVVTGRPARARAVLGGVALEPLPPAGRSWPPAVRCARFRTVGDREVRRHQVHGRRRAPPQRCAGPAPAGPARGRRAASRRATAVPVRGKMDVDPAAWSPGTALVALVVAGVVALGSRHLLTQVRARGRRAGARGRGAGGTCSGRGRTGGGRSGFGADAAAAPGSPAVLGLVRRACSGTRRWPARC